MICITTTLTFCLLVQPATFQGKPVKSNMPTSAPTVTNIVYK